MKALDLIGGTVIGAAFLAAGAASSIPAYKYVETSCGISNGGGTITLSDGSKIEAPGGGCNYTNVTRIGEGNLFKKTVRDVGGWVLQNR